MSELLAIHLPVITSRIEFQPIKTSRPPIITPRIDFNQEWGSDLNHDADEDTDMVSEHNYDSDPADSLIDDEDAADNNESTNNKKIPKPPGEPGRPNSGGYNIEHELRGWSPDMVTAVNVSCELQHYSIKFAYVSFLSQKFVKQMADDALDVTKSYSKQKISDITTLCIKVCILGSLQWLG